MPATVWQFFDIKQTQWPETGIYVNLMKLSGKIRQINIFGVFLSFGTTVGSSSRQEGGNAPSGVRSRHKRTRLAPGRVKPSSSSRPGTSSGCIGLAAWRRPAARRRHLARVQEVRGAQGAGCAEQSEATKNKDDIIMTRMTGNIFTRNFLLT